VHTNLSALIYHIHESAPPQRHSKRTADQQSHLHRSIARYTLNSYSYFVLFAALERCRHRCKEAFGLFHVHEAV